MVKERGRHQLEEQDGKKHRHLSVIQEYEPRLRADTLAGTWSVDGCGGLWRAVEGTFCAPVSIFRGSAPISKEM